MEKNLVITLSGKDRIGIVDRVTKEVLEYGGNVEASRMARLGGEFAMLMLVSIPAQKFEKLKERIHGLEDDGFSVVTCQTKQNDPVKYSGWMPYKIEVSGADHEGIIHHVTHRLADHRINIETMDTGMVKAPMSGTPLFMMSATVLVPPSFSFSALRDDMTIIGNELNVDIEVSPYKG
jgi:glycine cleavage system transcriptional repressor